MKKRIRASRLGCRCEKRLWFYANGVEMPVSEEVQRIFDIGKALEPMVVKWLRESGREVYYNEEGREGEEDFVLEVCGGEIVGRFDVIVDREVLMDIKTCGDFLFESLLMGEVPYEYKVQVNTYFFGLKLAGRDDIKELIDRIKKVGIIGVHKASGKLAEVVFDPDVSLFSEALGRACRVFTVQDPQSLQEHKDECARCEFKNLCRSEGGYIYPY